MNKAKQRRITLGAPAILTNVLADYQNGRI